MPYGAFRFHVPVFPGASKSSPKSFRIESSIPIFNLSFILYLIPTPKGILALRKTCSPVASVPPIPAKRYGVYRFV